MAKKAKGFFASLWESVAVRLAGKRVAILGARAVGKTRFINFLQTRTVPRPGTEYPSGGAQRVPGTRIDINGIIMYVAATDDVGGHESFYPEWKEISKDAKFVVYLFKADRLNAGDSYFSRRVIDDITAIRSWSKAKIVLVGTHSDNDPKYIDAVKKYDNKNRTYNDKLVENEVIAKAISIAGSLTEAKVVSGSLLDDTSTTELATQVFKAIDKWLS